MSGIRDASRRDGARAFLGPDPTIAEERRGAVARAWRPLDPAVAEALERQDARYAPSPARCAAIESLRRGAAAVVTGQQVGLFLGPLFTVYKAATAVRVARALAEESGREVVPVFWLQTEDHDLAEIAACRVARPEGELLELALPADGQRVSVAHRTLPEEVRDCVAKLGEALSGLPHGEAHVARLARHYRPGNGWGAAFAGVVAELFAADGLVIVDPRDAALAAAAAPVHARALATATELSATLEERARELERAGVEVPVHLRLGAPLSFFHPAGALGPRTRLEPASGGYVEAGGAARHTPESLLAALAADPLAFSTSALLRPIVQDHLLPTAAYVGGPGELAYFTQLVPLYARFGLPVPLVVPRARFRVVDRESRDLLSRHGLLPEDAARAEADLLARCGGGRGGDRAPADLPRELLGPFEAALDRLAPELAAVGEGMPTAIEKTRGTVRTAVSKLAAKHEKALRYRDPRLVAEVRRLQRTLRPGGAPQERVLGLASFAAREGDRAFVERVLAAVVPFDGEERDLP